MGVRSRFAAAAAVQLILLAFCGTASASSDCAGDSTQPTTDAAQDVAATALVCDINAFRTRNGLAPLSWNSRLASAAQEHAEDMAARHYFAHVSPDGRDVPDRVRPTGYIPSGSAWSLAENIGFGTNALSTPWSTVDGWTGSYAHRQNMLDAQMLDIGVGVARGGLSAGDDPGVFYVADFGATSDSGSSTAPRAHRSRKSRRCSTRKARSHRRTRCVRHRVLARSRGRL